jgi:hypothetical protein
MVQIIPEHMDLISDENIYWDIHSINGSSVQDAWREHLKTGLRVLHHKLKSTAIETQKMLKNVEYET